MIIKTRDYPHNLCCHEALLRRLPQNHPKYHQIESGWHKWKAGFKGEQALDYPLSFLPQNEYLIIQDLRLPSGEFHFQMDTLILTTKYFLIVEAKNISGTLEYDPNTKQVIRTYKGEEQGFSNPMAQSQHQFNQLQAYVKQIDGYRGEFLVVNTNLKAIYKTGHYSKLKNGNVVALESLLDTIYELNGKYKEVTTKKELKKFSSKLLKLHTPKKQNFLEYYKISPTELVSGVQCPECNHIPMIFLRGYWYCPSCTTKSKTAHESALIDYFLLISSSITNSKFRRFAHLNDDSVAKRILHNTNLKISGERKSRFYYANKIEFIKEKPLLL